MTRDDEDCGAAAAYAVLAILWSLIVFCAAYLTGAAGAFASLLVWGQ